MKTNLILHQWRYLTLLLWLSLFLEVEAFAQPQYFISEGTLSNAGAFMAGNSQPQIVFHSSEFPGAPPGFITTVYFRTSTPVSANFTNLKIMMAPTTLSTLSTGPFITAGLDTVLFASTFSATSGVNNWVPFQLQTPFFYDGVSNFLVLVSQEGFSPGFTIRYSSVTARSLYGNTTNNYGIPQDLLPDFGFDIIPLTATTDAGISAITAPVSPASPGQKNITVSVKNYGTDTLTSTTIGWSVNGLVQAPFSWTGSLPQDGVATGITLGSYNFPLGNHIIKTWSSMPNGVADTINSNDTATKNLIVSTLLSGIYTVGGATADFPTVQAAVNAAATSGISGPVTFNILPGTYNEQVTIPVIPGTSAANRVTFQSSTSNAADVIIAFTTASSTANYTVRLDGADYINLLNLTVQANHSSNARVIELTGGADDNIISGCVIYSNPLARASSTSAGIYSYTTLDHGNIITGNLIQNAYYSIYMYGSSSTVPEQGTIIENNTLEDFYYYGIYLYYQQSPKLIGNIISNHGSSATVYGIYGTDCQQELDFSKNRLNMTGSATVYGIYVSSCSALSDVVPGLISNNFITTSGAGATLYPLYVTSSNYQYVYHNSVLVVGGSATSRSVWFNDGGNNRNINNIYVMMGTGYATYVVGTPLVISDYNNYFTTATSLGYYGTTHLANLAALKSTSGMDLNSVFIDPQFASNSLLYPYNIAMNNLGTPLSLVVDDINGNLRDPLTPDMGAAEFSPANNDVGISVINEPGPLAGPGSNNISATIKNFGLSNLTLATLYFSVNGSTPVSYLWTGSLGPGNEAGPILIGSHLFTYGTHQVKVWASNPNGQTDPNSWNDTLVKTVYVCDVFGGTYTIGPTGSGADYTSFASALSEINSCGVAGPTIFNVLPGTYNEQVTIGALPGASALNTVTFQSSTGVASDVVIQYAAAGTADNWVVRLNGANHISLENLTIRTANVTGNFGRVLELINGASYNIIVNNIIESISGSTSTTTTGIYSGPSNDEYNVFAFNTIRYGYYGMYIYGPSTSVRENGNIIDGNILEDNYYTAIFLYYQSNVVVNNNTISTVSNSSNFLNIRPYQCSNGTVITRNRINMSSSSINYNYGIYLGSTLGTITDPALVANNFIAQTASSAGTVYMTYFGSSSYVRFYHNSINSMSPSMVYGAYVSTGNSNNEFVNNMVVNQGGGGYTVYGTTANLGSFTVFNYNNLYTTGTNLAYAGTAVTSLTAWQTATGFDTNSVSINPHFKTASLLYPSNFLVNDLGTPIATVPEDIDGKPRNTFTPDIGAVEFEPPQNDAGISAINGLSSPMAPGSAMISATVKNFGMLNLATAAIHWSVNGGPASTQQWTGFLSPLQETTPISIGSYTFGYGQHELKVWTSNPNGQTDDNVINDTMTMIIAVCDVMTGTYTIGASGANYPSFAAALGAMNNCGVGGAVIFNVQPGVYNEQIAIGEIPGTSAANTVTFQSSTGIAADVTVQYSPSGSANNYVIRLDGARYIILQHMTIKTAIGTGTYGRVIELTNGANHNTINGNVIESVQGTTSNSTACVYSGTSMDEYNIITNNTMRYGYYSIYLAGPSTTYFEHGTIIADNTLESYYYYGVNVEYQLNVIISGNTLSNASNSSTVYGMRTYYCYGANIITKNRITLAGTSSNYGIYAYMNPGSALNPGLIANNIIHQTLTSSGAVYTMQLDNAAYMRVYHNTARTRSTSNSNNGVYITTGNTGMEFVNNILVNEGNGYTIYGTVANLQLLSKCNYNNYYATGANLAYAGGAQPNLLAWQNATVLDSNSVSVDPGFLSFNNLTPGSATLNNLGTPLAAVPDDINGVLRNTLTPDMGAVEFDPLVIGAANVGFTAPTSGCNLGMQVVTIQINNHGAVDINGSLTASYRVVGSANVVTQAVPTMIPAGDTILFTFNSMVDLTTMRDTAFKLISWINLMGDPTPENDTATVIVNSFVTPPAPTVTDANVLYGQSATLSVINPDTAQVYLWYDAPASIQAIDTGVSYTTPALFNTTVYYVDAIYGDGFPAITIGTGTSTTSYLPTYGYYDYGWSSCIYTASEINATGMIQFISYYVGNAINFPMSDQRIYMKHTTDNVVSTAYPGTTGMTKVFQGNITWVGPGWNTIALTTPFFYNGNSNLFIHWENWNGNDSTSYPSFRYTQTTTYQAVYRHADGSFPTVFGLQTSYRPNIILEGGFNGCYSPRVPDTVFVDSPVVFVNLGSDVSICQGDTTQLNAVVSGGVAPYTYSWSPAASLNSASIPNPLAFPQVNTTYSVTVTDQNSDMGSDDVIISVKPLPNVIFPALPSVYDNTPPFPLTGGTPVGGTYSGPGVTGGIFNPAVAGVGSHTITYCYTDPVSGCTGSATSVQQVTPWVGIGEIAAGQGFAIWPNPSTGVVMLTVKTNNASMQLEVLDVQGKVVMDRRLINATGRHELDLTALPQGVYQIRLVGDTETYLQKLILR